MPMAGLGAATAPQGAGGPGRHSIAVGIAMSVGRSIRRAGKVNGPPRKSDKGDKAGQT